MIQGNDKTTAAVTVTCNLQTAVCSTGTIPVQNSNTYSNLAVSGSISSSSLTGDFGILARKASETFK